MFQGRLSHLFFSQRYFGYIFAKTFWSLRYFGHLSHSCIKTHRNSVSLTYIFSHFDRNNLIFSAISKQFLSMTKKTGLH